MKLKTLLTLSIALVLAPGLARAVHVWEDPGGWSSTMLTYDVKNLKYTANELSLDLGASYIYGETSLHKVFETSIKHGRWGGDVGVNYFFTKWTGIGGDINMSDNGGSFLDQAIGNIIVRVPIEPLGLAPYIFGGGGREFDPHWAWLGDAGVGLELRFNPVVGIFGDVRYIWSDHTKDDRAMIRFGMRLIF